MPAMLLHRSRYLDLPGPGGGDADPATPEGPDRTTTAGASA
jgi:hypothetical protein